MSFAQTVKQELLQAALEPYETPAFLSALFAINGQYDGKTLTFKSVSLGLIRRVMALIKSMYDVPIEINHEDDEKLTQLKYHYLILPEPDVLIHELGLMENEVFAERIDEVILTRKEAKVAYIKGAFLASGSLNSPESSSYHLEIKTHHAKIAEDIRELLESLFLPSKVLKRRQSLYIIYIKESEKIADFLRTVGARNALFTFEDERIKRDFYNSITRVMNIELANQNKTIMAADKQLKNIAILENIGDIDDLPAGLIEAIELRKKYPELSLIELSLKAETDLNKRITKSGLNHRFRQIEALAVSAMEGYHATHTRR